MPSWPWPSSWPRLTRYSRAVDVVISGLRAELDGAVLVSEGTADRDGNCDPYVLLCYHRPGADDVYEDLDDALADGTGFVKTGTITDSLAPVWPDEQVCSPFATRALAAKHV